MNETETLLRAFVQDGSETAFRELVKRYVELVYSTALRRMDGDAHRAEDVAQMVFIDLARKAASLPAKVMLGGWLHRHCCFVAANMRRSEARRAAREKEAVTMEAATESNWNDLAPELDEAVQELDEEDRDAILLRFFEKRDFKGVAEAIGGSENAAQKRVARALEKLRGLLQQRGVVLSAATLGALLAEQCVAAAPGQVFSKIIAKAGVGVGALAYAFWLLAAFLLVGGGVAIFKKSEKSGTTTALTNAAPQVAKTLATIAVPPRPTSPQTVTRTAAAPAPAAEVAGMKLTIVAAESGVAIPNVAIVYRMKEGARSVNKTLAGSRLGVCVVPLGAATTELELITQTEDFADMRLSWKIAEGDMIPKEHTARLTRGTRIGGKVVDERGELVRGAKIILNLWPDAEALLKTESHEFRYIEAAADDGTWQTARIANSVLRRINVYATHPSFVESDSISLREKPDELKAMQALEHVLQMHEGTVVRGIVLSEENEPIAGAEILVGGVHEGGSQKGKSRADGKFEIHGSVPREKRVTASAKGFAPTTIEMEQKAEPCRIVLKRGTILKLRLVDVEGKPIPNATVGISTLPEMLPNGTEKWPLQVKFSAKTDADGRVRWEDAPALEIGFDIYAKGFMRRDEVRVTPDGLEHSVTMAPALTIYGTATDSETGAAIPKFKMIAGWPETYARPGETNRAIHWSDIDRHWMQFTGGKYSRAFEESMVMGVKEDLFAFKFEAEGYAPIVSRIIKANEGKVEMNLAMRRSIAAKLTVLGPDGRPAADVSVAFPSARQIIYVSGGGFGRNNGMNMRMTDARGQVALEGGEGVVKVAAASTAGFAMANPAELQASPNLQLRPWGRVQGTVTRRGKPVAGWLAALRSNHDRAGLFIEVAPQVATDAQGNFSFTQVPPGILCFSSHGQMANEDFWITNPLKEIEVTPGETTVVNYDENVAAATVTVRLPEGFKMTDDMRMTCSGRSSVEPLPREIMGNIEAMRQWRLSPAYLSTMHLRREFGFRETPEGIWKCEDVPAGQVFVSAMVLNKKDGRPVLVGHIKAEIPQEPGEAPLALGEIALAPFQPRPQSP